uniref:Protein-L-isoaspartate (D-aspartate) O-methyltransferase n=2 Tax=Homininae TaxID=207598 RepID=H7C4X2_HUMAN
MAWKSGGASHSELIHNLRSMMAHTCNTSTLGGRGRWIT